MSTLEDLSNISEPSYKQPKETLLNKYRIPIQHFEFHYVEKCKDTEELEKILIVLRSGEEGHYPDLIKSTEERLKVLKPKSKLLRIITPVVNKTDLKKDELEELYKDLDNWVHEVSKNDKELESRKINAPHHLTEVRTTKQSSTDKGARGKEKRISSTDYSAWDKYDPDTELLKEELTEETEKKTIIAQNKVSKNHKSVSFNKFGTEAEANFISNREREKGNEFFKNGEYEEALHFYSNSIFIKPSVSNLNNRAVTYLKLKKYQEALEDCEKVLTMEKDNLKAYLRKAEALEKLGKFEEALQTIELVIRKDPNNDVAQELAEKIRENFSNCLTNTRMKIVEIG